VRRSLGTSAALLLAGINLLVFGAGFLWLSQVMSERRDLERLEIERTLEDLLQNFIINDEKVHAGGILSWNKWGRFRDALVVRFSEETLEDDRAPRGIYINPLGIQARSPEFEEDAVLSDLRRAVRQRRIMRNARGTFVPLLDQKSRTWGGCWYLQREDMTLQSLARSIVPWFLVSTVLITLVSWLGLSRLVLTPVRQLARGTSRLASGQLGARLTESSASDELSELVRGFNKMALELDSAGQHLAREVEIATSKAREAEAVLMTQRRLAATGELAAGIAHEINNPLGGMLNALAALERDDLPEERRSQYLELVRSGLQRIEQTVGQVLRLAPRQTQTEPISLSGPVADALGLVRHRAERDGVGIVMGSLEGELTAIAQGTPRLPETPLFMGEANEIGQAVLNLLVNALDALGEPGAPEAGQREIQLRMGATEQEVHLVVADNGPGVARDVLERAADIFFTTKETGRGTGLGLAIVHNVIDGHGGKVLLSSEQGVGFRAELVLPRWTGEGRGREGVGS